VALSSAAIRGDPDRKDACEIDADLVELMRSPPVTGSLMPAAETAAARANYGMIHGMIPPPEPINRVRANEATPRQNICL
jgi:hypothetical protein